MRKRAWWLGAVTALIVLPVAAVAVAVAVVDPNDYKPQIVAAVQDATGRAFSLNGKLRVSRSLWPTIEVSDVTLANLPGASRPDMARAERIEAQLSLPALLWHRIEVVTLTLVGPNIVFEQVDGKSNWVFEPPERARSGPAPASGSPFLLRIRNVHVQNGMVTWRLPARTKVLGIRALDLRHHTDGGPLDLTATLVYSDNQPFSLQASAQPTAGLSGPWATQMEFAAFDTTASAKGTMTLAGSYDLQVDAKSGALEKLNALLPEMRLPALHQAVLSTRLTNGPVPGDLPVVGATRLQFATADLSDRVSGLRFGATSVTVPAAGGSATVTGTGRYAGQPFALGGTVAVPAHPDGRVVLPIDLTLQSAPGGNEAAAIAGSLALKGKLTLDTLRFGGLDAVAALRMPALAALRPVLPPALASALPALTAVQFDGRVAIPANIRTVGIKDATLRTQAGDVAGDGTIGLDAGAALTAKLRSTRLDLDALLAAFGATLPSIPAAGTAGPVIPDTPLPWAALRGPNLDIAASIGSMSFQGQAWQSVDLALQLKGGRLQLGSVKLALPGGPVEMSMTADASVAAVPVSLALRAPAFPLALVARAAGLPGAVSGSVRIEAQFRGQGRSLRDFAASLDGPLSATMVGGQISNAAFVKLTSASLDALGIAVPAQGETAIRCFGVVGAFGKGVGRFRTIALETSYLSLDGAGQVDLGQETVAFKLHPLAQISGSAVSVPVVVEGPFRAIKGTLDATGLDKLGLLIDAWFGGDEAQACSDAGLVPSRAGRR